MKFLKENSYDIVKLFVNQIGIAIFSMALYSAVSIAMPGGGLSSTIEIVISIFATLFYLVLVYTAMWEIGAKDKIRIDGGKMEKFPLKGFLMGLVSNSPNFVLCGLGIVFMGIYLSGGAEWTSVVFALLNPFFAFIESMYLGIIINLIPVAEDSTAHLSNVVYFNRAIAYFCMPFISVATITIGYWLGSNDFRMFSFMGKIGSKIKK